MCCIFFLMCRVGSFSLSYIYIKLINSFVIFPDLSCLISYGIDYYPTHAQIHPGTTVSRPAGNFNQPDICWKSSMVSSRQSSRFLECIEKTF